MTTVGEAEKIKHVHFSAASETFLHYSNGNAGSTVVAMIREDGKAGQKEERGERVEIKWK